MNETSTSDRHARPALPHLRWGAIVDYQGCTHFHLWAPAHDSMILEIADADDMRTFEMQDNGDGCFTIEVDDCPDGTRYRYQLPTGESRPDPASRFQPEGVHGWSAVVNPHTYAWHDNDWPGIAKADLIIYELQLGCFTAGGTYRAAIDRLDELVELGVTAIELMPIADAPGRWNWGYDGVDLFAPRHTYGTPDDLRQLVDAAHQRGLAVLLDVVYNHLGPEGNYWGEFGPYLSARHSTPWGSAPNFDGEQSDRVREFFISNATYWIDEYHFDGLRIDAVHCMADDREPHIMAEIGTAIATLQQQTKRTLHLIAESNVYDPEMLASSQAGGHGCDALWCDDFLHAMFAILRPGDQMSSRQYHPHADLDATLRRGFVFQGTLREARRRIPLEETDGGPPVPVDSLIYAIQNHDFIGNHPQGRRLHQLTSPDAQRAAAALLLLCPAIPMLFMGEEFAAENPFFFFVDFGDEHLREAVETGRRREYPQHDWTDVASPLSSEAFERSKIGPATDGDSSMLAWYRRLIALRRQWKAAGFLHPQTTHAHWNAEGHFAQLTYGDGTDQRFAFVRLHPAGEFPQRVRLTGATDIVLSQHCEQDVDATEPTWLLGEHAVAIGHGPIVVHPVK